jgi:hypothetical protein
MELNEWRKINGGGSINEYYAYLKREGISNPANTNREETNDTSNRNRGNAVNEKHGGKFGDLWIAGGKLWKFIVYVQSYNG